MTTTRRAVIGFASLTALHAAAWGEESPPKAGPPKPPEVAREFRAAWIATVANIDWPTKPGLAPEAMRAELAELLDLAVELKLNAVVLQVRPACDTLYASELEPWSEYLTGKQGRAPADGFDPLTWACEQAHARGLELHAWFNPYRAAHPSAKGPLDSSHIVVRRPDLAPEYGEQRWLDPGDPEAAEHSREVMLDVVRRYDVDAVHFDDYFYPYPITEEGADGQKREVPFPDDASWARYVEQTPEPQRLGRNDWRRDNVNRFVRDLGPALREVKPHVRLGISPFGIWRPGNPPGIQGFDQYDKLYADARLWLREGWVDYFSPQLYWAIDQAPQSFTRLLAWWAEENVKRRHLWPGLFTSKVGGANPSYPPQEIVDQIVATREQQGADGHIHFSIKALAGDWGGLATALREGVYAEPALVPATTWLSGDTPPPAAPTVERVAGAEPPTFRLSSPDGAATRWVLQKRTGGVWTTAVTGATLNEVRLRPDTQGESADTLAVSAIDRLGRQSEPTVVVLEGSSPKESP